MAGPLFCGDSAFPFLSAHQLAQKQLEGYLKNPGNFLDWRL